MAASSTQDALIEPNPLLQLGSNSTTRDLPLPLSVYLHLWRGSSGAFKAERTRGIEVAITPGEAVA